MLMRLLKSGFLAALVSAAVMLVAVVVSVVSPLIWLWLHISSNESGIGAVAGGVSPTVALVVLACFLLSFWYFWRRSKP
jgi:hypothetical protein